MKGGIPTRKQRPPLYTRLLIYVPGLGWRTGYFAEYDGRPKAILHGANCRWNGKYWSPLFVTTESGALVEAAA